VLDVVKKILGPLLAGGMIYAPIALLLPGDSALALVGAVLLATGFWATFVLIIPRYRALIVESRAGQKGDPHGR